MNNNKTEKSLVDKFKKRFKTNINISLEKYYEDFYLDFINEVAKEYKKEIIEKNNNGDIAYLEKEKIRLKVTIDNLSRKNFTWDWISGFASSFTVLYTFHIGKIFEQNWNSLKFTMQNIADQMSKVSSMNEINKIVQDNMIGNTNIITFSLKHMLVIIGGLFLFYEFVSKKRAAKNDRELVFNKICYKVLKKIEEKKI